MLPMAENELQAERTLNPHYQQLQPYAPSNLAVGLSFPNSIDDTESSASPAERAHHLNTTAPSFLDWDTFDEATLPPRANARRSRLDRVLFPLRSVRADLPGRVGVDGLGGVIESAHGLFHSVRRLDFMESARTIYILPRPGGAPSPGSRPRRELERYENELFDLSKYAGSCSYFTALAWTEESLAGSITLYEVLFGEEGETVGVRPIAAMRDVPSPVLVKMRTDERIERKAVLTPSGDDDWSFEWRASPGRKPQYVELTKAESSLSPPRSRSRNRRVPLGASLAKGDGICTTIPQFVALLHARRTILESVKSSRISQRTTGESGDSPVVFLTQLPLSNPHDGAGVHVAVLVPNDAPWAGEEIVWTGAAGLAELRQRQYWPLIKPADIRGRSRGRSRRRGEERHGHAPSMQERES